MKKVYKRPEDFPPIIDIRFCKEGFDGVKHLSPRGLRNKMTRTQALAWHREHGEIPPELWRKPGKKKRRGPGHFLASPRNRPRDMSGMIIGALHVLRLTGSNCFRHWIFECRCACSEIVIRSGVQLRAALKRGQDPACDKCRAERSRANLARMLGRGPVPVSPLYIGF